MALLLAWAALAGCEERVTKGDACARFGEKVAECVDSVAPILCRSDSACAELLTDARAIPAVEKDFTMACLHAVGDVELRDGEARKWIAELDAESCTDFAQGLTVGSGMVLIDPRRRAAPTSLGSGSGVAGSGATTH